MTTLSTASTNLDKILNGTLCPYCNNTPVIVADTMVYRVSYGRNISLCVVCGAYVTCHKDGTPMGRLADAQLRKAKKSAHYYFDKLWNRHIRLHGSTKSYARSLAYQWLSEQMKLPIHLTHIGMFDIDQCNMVIDLCKPYCHNQDTKATTPMSNIENRL